MVHVNHTYKSVILKANTQSLKEASAKKCDLEGGTWSTNVREVLLENLKTSPCPGVELLKTIPCPTIPCRAMSLSFFKKNLALPLRFVEFYHKMRNCCYSSDLNHIRGVQMAYSDVLESAMKNMDAAIEPTIQI